MISRCRKAFFKIQHPFMIKTLSTPAREESPQLDKEYLQIYLIVETNALFKKLKH